MRSYVDNYIRSVGSRLSERLIIVISRFLSWISRSKMNRPGNSASLNHMAQLSTITLTQSFHSLTSLKRISLSHSFSLLLVSVYKMRSGNWITNTCSSKLKTLNGACYLRNKKINLMQLATFDTACTKWISMNKMTTKTSSCRKIASLNLLNKRRIRISVTSRKAPNYLRKEETLLCKWSRRWTARTGHYPHWKIKSGKVLRSISQYINYLTISIKP